MAEYFLKVFLDESKEVDYEVIEFDETKQKRLEFYYENMNCGLIDIVGPGTGVEFVVDEEGVLASNNPIFIARMDDMPEGDTFTIVGTFLVGMFNGVDETVGFSSVDSLDSRLGNHLQVGFTRKYTE